jgi:hypothetical protein
MAIVECEAVGVKSADCAAVSERLKIPGRSPEGVAQTKLVRYAIESEPMLSEQSAPV